MCVIVCDVLMCDVLWVNSIVSVGVVISFLFGVGVIVLLFR